MRTYVICEIGINHNGSLEIAKWLIDAAKEAGADAVKFQKRTVDVVYTGQELSQPRQSPFGSTNADLKYGLELSPESYAAIARQCEEVGIDWSASAWDRASVEFIASFNPPWLKIPSALITNKPLLEAYRATQCDLIVSTGMSTWEEIDGAVETLRHEGFVNFNTDPPTEKWPTLTLLHCHSSYPSPLEEINLACINSFKERYPGVKVGYSSHTVSPWPCLMAVVYGAEVVEAHLTLDRTNWGTDQPASLEPAAFKKLIEEIRTWEKVKGDGQKRVYESELPIRAKLRR